MENLRNQYQHQVSVVSVIKDHRRRRDLLKMLKTVDGILTEIDKESIRCRRLQHATVLYKALVKKCKDQLQVVDQYVLVSTIIS